MKQFCFLFEPQFSPLTIASNRSLAHTEIPREGAVGAGETEGCEDFCGERAFAEQNEYGAQAGVHGAGEEGRGRVK